MALEINAQYNKFVQFAEQQMRAGNEKAIARDGGEVAGGGPLAEHVITAASGDKVAPFKRSQSNKDANDVVRDLFRQSIIDMFGNEAMIPQSVRDAMKLDDYGHGKPLTARRIMAVKAEVDRIVSVHTAFNARIVSNIADNHFDRLPQDVQDGLAQIVSGFRGIFGEAVVPPGTTIQQLLHPSHVQGELRALRDTANAQGRDLTAGEVVGVYAGKVFERRVATTVGSSLFAKIKAREPDIPFTELSICSQFDKAHPGLLAEIRNCGNPGDIAAAIQRHEAEIDTFVDIVVRSNAASKAVESKATEKFAAAMGIDNRLAVAHLLMGELRSQAKDLATSILQGDAPGSKEPGYDVEAAYDALVNEFVQKRVDACAAIDSLDLPEDVKNRWKAEYTAYRSLPPLTPAQLFEVSNALDARKLEGVFSKGMPVKLAVEMLNNIANTLADAICTVTNDPMFFEKVGVDDQMPLYGMLIAVAEAKNPALASAIQNVRTTFFDSADAYCEANANSFPHASTFLRSLAIKGGTVKELPVTDKEKYLAVVEEEAETVLTECGITDVNVRKVVKDWMAKRGDAELARATGLKSLSDFLATIKADITAIKTKQNEMVAKYADGLAQETAPLLAKLVSVLDWRPRAAAASEEIVKNYAEDMKAWRNVALGSPDSKGLEEVFLRRMNGYLKDVLAGNAHASFNTDKHPGLFQTFLDDLPRCRYVINGKTVQGTTLQEKIVPFLAAIKDPAKRKVVSVMINQQVYGDYTASVANRLPFSGWKNNMPDEPVDTIPGIEKFSSRDVTKTGFQVVGTGPMEFAIGVSPDESTVTVRCTSDYPVLADLTLQGTSIGTCSVKQEFVIDFTGAEPVIRDFKIGQTLA